MLIWLILLSIQGTMGSLVNLDDPSDLRELFEVELNSLRIFLRPEPEIVVHLELILECNNPILSIENKNDLFLDDIRVLKFKFRHINSLQSILKRKKHFEQLTRLFLIGMDYVNRSITNLKIEFIKKTPSCSLEDLTIFESRHRQMISCHRFAFYSLHYIKYFEFVHNESKVFTLPQTFVFSNLDDQVDIALKYLKEYPKSRRYMKKARELVTFLKDMVDFEFMYDSQVVSMLPPNSYVNDLGHRLLNAYNQKKYGFERLLLQLTG
jgi:hypothetical protein